MSFIEEVLEGRHEEEVDKIDRHYNQQKIDADTGYQYDEKYL